MQNIRYIIEDDLRDIAIQVVDVLIAKGYVPDCTDTDDMTEFEVQDIIVEGLMEQLPDKPSHPWVLVPSDEEVLAELGWNNKPKQ
jgi:hypothetical protein|tara:strand:- start:156 stop:410 length:255 start_codon:yes stop_codon:yes gene_type:complete